MWMSFYEVLKLTPQSTSDDVKRAYRKCVLLYHPDKNAAPEAAAMLTKVQEAYDTLCDVEKRRRYDELLGKKSTSWGNVSSSAAIKKHRKQTGSFKRKSQDADANHQRSLLEKEAILLFESLRPSERNRPLEENDCLGVHFWDDFSEISDLVPERTVEKVSGRITKILRGKRSENSILGDVLRLDESRVRGKLSTS